MAFFASRNIFFSFPSSFRFFFFVFLLALCFLYKSIFLPLAGECDVCVCALYACTQREKWRYICFLHQQHYFHFFRKNFLFFSRPHSRQIITIIIKKTRASRKKNFKLLPSDIIVFVSTTTQTLPPNLNAKYIWCLPSSHHPRNKPFLSLYIAIDI